MVCPNCGENNYGIVKTCKKCGKDLLNQNQNQNNQNMQTNAYGNQSNNYNAYNSQNNNYNTQYNNGYNGQYNNGYSNGYNNGYTNQYNYPQNNPQYGNGYNMNYNSQPMNIQNGNYPQNNIIDYDKLDEEKQKKQSIDIKLIGIIGACLLALIILIVVVVSLFNSNKEEMDPNNPSPIETTIQVPVMTDTTLYPITAYRNNSNEIVFPDKDVVAERTILDMLEDFDYSNYKLVGDKNVGYILVPKECELVHRTSNNIQYATKSGTTAITITSFNSQSVSSVLKGMQNIITQSEDKSTILYKEHNDDYGYLEAYYPDYKMYVYCYVISYEENPNVYYLISIEGTKETLENVKNIQNTFVPKIEKTIMLPYDLKNISQR